MSITRMPRIPRPSPATPFAQSPWKVALAIVVPLLLASLLLIWLCTQDVVITISQAELQRRLDSAFPIHKTYLGAVQLTLSHPQVHLDAGSDRLAMGIDANADALGGLVHAGGTGRLSGQVRFVPAAQTLYLDNVAVEQMDIHGLPSQYADIVRAGAGIAAGEYFDHHMLYQVPRIKLGWPLSGRRVKSVQVEDGAVKITLTR